MVPFALGSGAFWNGGRVPFASGSGTFWNGGRVPFASGSGAHHLSPANATGLGALAAAPPTPPAPPVTLAASRSPRLTASGFGTGRDATSLWLTPSDGIHAVSPGLPRTPRRGRWGPTPPRYFQVINGKNKIIAMSMRNTHSDKRYSEKRQM